MRNTGICLIGTMLAMLVLAGCSRESADWKSASAADTIESYGQFVHQYPHSANVPAANTRLATLMDDHDWQAAAATDTRVAYEQFIAQHADSKWVQEARIRIENFSGAAASAAPGPAGEAPLPPTASPSRPANVAASQHKAASPTKVAVAAHGNFVQLGAFSSRARAQSEWKQLAAKFPSELKTLKPDYVEGTAKGGHVYKLRVPVSSVAAARDLCGALKKHSQRCLAVTA